MVTLAGYDPIVQPALDSLAAYLATEGYSTSARSVILSHVAAEGTLEGLVAAGALEPADEPAAEEAFVNGFAPTCVCDPAWDEYATEPGQGARYEPVRTLRCVPPEIDADEDEIARLIDLWDLRMERGPGHGESFETATPVTLDVEPSGPSAEDLEDHRRWSARIDAMLPPVCGGSPEPDPYEFPRDKTAADRRRDTDAALRGDMIVRG